VPPITNLPIEDLEASIEAATGMRLLEDGTLPLPDASERDAPRGMTAEGAAARTSLQ
jgi:hypothetical protein